MPHEIRPGTPEDIESVEIVRITTWKDVYRGILSDDFLDALAVEEREVELRRQGLARALAEGRTPLFVGEVEGRIVGFANLGRARPSDGIGGGEIFAIYVLPTAQSAGLGRALMTAVVEQLRLDGHKEVGLWVASGNAGSRRFYERFGLVPSGRVKIDEDLAVEETHYTMSL